MAFSSRSYARPYLSGGGLPPAVKILLIINTVVFLALFFGRGAMAQIFAPLALTPYAVVHSFAVWQLGTYLFLHTGVLGFVFNMLALWMFGRQLEESWGTRNFVKFYFLCGSGAGVFAILAAFAFGEQAAAIIGSIGAIYGILGAYAALWPEQEVLFIFFPMKMKWFVLLIAAVDFLITFGSAAQMALLTGMVIGYFYVRAPRRKRAPRASLGGTVRAAYRDWKLKRAKRKFQVYLKKKGSDRDPWVN